MFEESISSSPCKSETSIRKLRCTRRTNRKGQPVKCQDIQEKNMPNRILQHLYDSDEDYPEQIDPGNTTFILDSAVTDFKPFRMERHLCFDDRSSSSKPPTSKNEAVSETSGFLPCLTTLESERNIVVPNDDNCWYQVGEVSMSTPVKRLRLVNSILEDFSLSPYAEKPKENAMFLEYSPEFVLKSKPRITYSSRQRNTQGADYKKRLDFPSNDNCLSDSSSISVQENFTQLGLVSTTSNVPDTTERLCANLLNLSAYYTQSLDQNTADISAVEFKEDNETMDMLPIFSNVVSLLQDITLLSETRSHKTWSSYSSSQDFYGFPEVNIDQDVNETTLLAKRCCRSEVKLLIPMDTQKLDEDPEMISDVVDRKGEHFDEWEEDYMEIFAFIKTPPHSCKTEVKKPVDVVEQIRYNGYSGFKTGSSNQIHTSQDAQSITADILKNIPEIIPIETVKRDIFNTTSVQVRQDININDSEILSRTGINNVYDQPSTSKAALKLNMEYERRRHFFCDLTAQQAIVDTPIGTPSTQIKYLNGENPTNEKVIFNNYIEVPKNADGSVDFNEVKDEINQINYLNSPQESKADRHTGSNEHTRVRFLSSNEPLQKQLAKSNNYIGFQTANGKNIKPTNKALKSVQKLLKEFQSDLEQFDENSLELMKNKMNLKQCKQSTSDTKPINGKGKNKLWAEEEDLSDVFFSEWPLEEQLKEQNSITTMPSCIETKQTPLKSNTLNTNFEGFRTAAGKNVSISEKGKKIAETLLQNIKSDSKDLLEIKSSIHRRNNKTVVAHNPIIAHNDSIYGFKDIAICEETVDSCHKAQYKHLHASKTCQSKTSNSFTELSSKSSLNISANNSIIARKNLLSLSRKRKGRCPISPAKCTNGNSLEGTIKELPSDLADTPNKKHYSINTIPQVLKTPSTPNGNELCFNTSKCSTPHTEQSIISPRKTDDDFNTISWNDNKSISNTNLNSSNPSINDRIARLRMYGEPPPISPILKNIQSNCRSSGLRPTRSMLKKAENK